MARKKIKRGMMAYLPGLAPPRKATVKATYTTIPNPEPDPWVQKTFEDMGVKAVAKSADGDSYTHHHAIVNSCLFACYGTEEAARLAVERILALPGGHAAFARTFTSEYEGCRGAERTRTPDDRVQSGDGVVAGKDG